MLIYVIYVQFKGNLTGTRYNRAEFFSDANCTISDNISYGIADNACHAIPGGSLVASSSGGKIDIYTDTTNCTGTVMSFVPTSIRNACQTRTETDGTRSYYTISATNSNAYLSTSVIIMSFVASIFMILN